MAYKSDFAVFKCCEVPKTIFQTEIRHTHNSVTKGVAILMLGFSHTIAILKSKNESSLKAGRKQATVIIIFPALPKHFPNPTQVDGKPKQLAWACEVLAKGLPTPDELLFVFPAFRLSSVCPS